MSALTELSSGLLQVTVTRKETILIISAKVISNAEAGGCLGPGVSELPPLLVRLVLVDDLLDDVLGGRVGPETCPTNDVVPATPSEVRPDLTDCLLTCRSRRVERGGPDQGWPV